MKTLSKLIKTLLKPIGTIGPRVSAEHRVDCDLGGRGGVQLGQRSDRTKPPPGGGRAAAPGNPSEARDNPGPR